MIFKAPTPPMMFSWGGQAHIKSLISYLQNAQNFLHLFRDRGSGAELQTMSVKTSWDIFPRGANYAFASLPTDNKTIFYAIIN